MNAQAYATKALAKSANTQATQAVKQSTLASQQLDLSERPWMKADIILDRPIIVGPDGFFHIDVSIKSQNVGRSTALKVKTRADVIPLGEIDLEQTDHKLCEQAHTDVLYGDGDAVFPDAPYQITKPLLLSDAVIKQELLRPSSNTFVNKNGQTIGIVGNTFTDSDGRVSNVFVRSAGLIPDPQFAVIGCLDYTISYSQERHQTMFLYDLTGVNFRTHDVSKAALEKHFGWGNSAN